MIVREAWGVIRPSKDGQWNLVDNETHKSVGIKCVHQTEKYVQIDYDFPPMKMIHWTAVTPDEQMILHNVQVGASARLDCTRVYFAKMCVRLDPETLKLGDNANFWFYVKGEN